MKYFIYHNKNYFLKAKLPWSDCIKFIMAANFRRNSKLWIKGVNISINGI